MNKIILAAAFSAGVTAATSASAIPLNFAFSGTSSIGTLYATASQVDVANIDITLDATSLTGTQFVSEFYFNTEDFEELTFDNRSPSVAHATWSSETDTVGDTNKADGTGGYFDHFVSFDTGEGEDFNRLSAGESLTFRITAADGSISLSQLLGLSKEKNKPGFEGYMVAAHIQNIGSAGDSGWMACKVNCQPFGGVAPPPSNIPLPAGLPLLATGLAGLGFFIRRRRKTA